MSLHPRRLFIMRHRRRLSTTGLWSMDLHMGTAITGTVTANLALASASARFCFGSGD